MLGSINPTLTLPIPPKLHELIDIKTKDTRTILANLKGFNAMFFNVTKGFKLRHGN
jgi:hypothetical protein